MKRYPMYKNKRFKLIKVEGQKIFILLQGETKPIWILKNTLKYKTWN